MEPYIWAIIIVAALIIEAATTMSLSSVWFACAGIISLIISFFGQGTGFIIAEVLVFIIISFLLLFLVGPIARKAIKKKVATNIDAFEGKEALALSDVAKFKDGKAKMNDIIYTIKSDEEIKTGEVVVVVRLEGNKLIVKKREKN